MQISDDLVKALEYQKAELELKVELEELRKQQENVKCKENIYQELYEFSGPAEDVISALRLLTQVCKEEKNLAEEINQKETKFKLLTLLFNTHHSLSSIPPEITDRICKYSKPKYI